MLFFRKKIKMTVKFVTVLFIFIFQSFHVFIHFLFPTPKSLFNRISSFLGLYTSNVFVQRSFFNDIVRTPIDKDSKVNRSGHYLYFDTLRGILSFFVFLDLLFIFFDLDFIYRFVILKCFLTISFVGVGGSSNLSIRQHES